MRRAGFIPGLSLSRLLLAALAVVLVAAQPAAARYQAGGFNLGELTALAGAGPDPGPGNLQARLDWAVATAVPPEWRAAVPVVWSVGATGAGNLALSHPDGRSVVSPRLMARPAEEVIATVAHEMGHQIAFAVVSPVVGMPPQGFLDLSRGAVAEPREAWADCVARVWTGSALFARGEPGPCSPELTEYVAGVVTDPAALEAAARVVPTPAPSVTTSTPPPAPPAPAVPADPGGPPLAVRLIVVVVVVGAIRYWYGRRAGRKGPLDDASPKDDRPAT